MGFLHLYLLILLQGHPRSLQQQPLKDPHTAGDSRAHPEQQHGTGLWVLGGTLNFPHCVHRSSIQLQGRIVFLGCFNNMHAGLHTFWVQLNVSRLLCCERNAKSVLSHPELYSSYKLCRRPLRNQKPLVRGALVASAPSVDPSSAPSPAAGLLTRVYSTSSMMGTPHTSVHRK